ncbi:MAG TPA: response regulator [Candidatus Paceibacterota bacterium]|nr:response regulator [Candidatus Paceibacterota bacterium]
MTESEPYSVLLLDDDQFLLDMYAKKFSDEGYEVQSCQSVPEAVQILEKGFPADAIVFDLTMPQDDGFALLQLLREKQLSPAAVKVVLTNQSSEEEEAKTKALGADAYIVKATMIPSEVFATINGMVASRRGA